AASLRPNTVERLEPRRSRERLALDAMGRRLPGVDVPGVDASTSTSACWPTVLPTGIVALRGRLTYGPRSPAARRPEALVALVHRNTDLWDRFSAWIPVPR